MEDLKQTDTRTWPYATYPFRHPQTGMPVTNVFKAEIQNEDGKTEFHPITFRQKNNAGIEEEVTQAIHPKMALVTSMFSMPAKKQDMTIFNGMTDHIKPEDLRNAEELMGGMPTVVKFGLWARWDGSKWIKTDRMKVNSPDLWVDITDSSCLPDKTPLRTYYDDMRKEAYNDEFPDPFTHQHRPFTRIQKLEKELAEKEKELKASIKTTSKSGEKEPVKKTVAERFDRTESLKKAREARAAKAAARMAGEPKA